jgi:membrane protein DedA with SNARE-associated domain
VLVAGVLLVVLSWGSLGHLFGGYQDSPAWTYLLFGLVFVLPGLVLILWSWRLFRPPGLPD